MNFNKFHVQVKDTAVYNDQTPYKIKILIIYIIYILYVRRKLYFRYFCVLIESFSFEVKLKIIFDNFKQKFTKIGCIYTYTTS